MATRLQMDIAGALLDGVLQQPVDDVHDVCVVCGGLRLTLAEFKQVFQLAQAGGLLVLRTLYRVGQAKSDWPSWRICCGLASTRRMGLPRLRARSACHSC